VLSDSLDEIKKETYEKLLTYSSKGVDEAEIARKTPFWWLEITQHSKMHHVFSKQQLSFRKSSSSTKYRIPTSKWIGRRKDRREEDFTPKTPSLMKKCCV